MMKDLLDQIEKLRYGLYALSDGKELVDPEVVQVSQELDRLLNEYHNQARDFSDFRRAG